MLFGYQSLTYLLNYFLIDKPDKGGVLPEAEALAGPLFQVSHRLKPRPPGRICANFKCFVY